MFLHPRWTVASKYSGRIDFRSVMDRVGGADAFETAGADQLRQGGAVGRLLQELCSVTEIDDIGSLSAVRMGDPHYPDALYDLPRAPPVLWVRGDLGLLGIRGLAVVGARSCTSYGSSIAGALGRMEALVGGVLISGGARGIDMAAHRGAMGNGRTVVVLGAGLSAQSSRFRRRFFDEILHSGGLLISEFAPHCPPSKWSFPQRNRVVAALSRGVVIVEAARRSGALITADFAHELGRDVFAVPGPIGAPASEGCNLLIQDGAQILLKTGDAIWDSRGDRLQGFPKLLALLRTGPKTLGHLSAVLNKEVRSIALEVSTYEGAGLVRRMSGSQVMLT